MNESEPQIDPSSTSSNGALPPLTGRSGTEVARTDLLPQTTDADETSSAARDMQILIDEIDESLRLLDEVLQKSQPAHTTGALRVVFERREKSRGCVLTPRVVEYIKMGTGYRYEHVPPTRLSRRARARDRFAFHAITTKAVLGRIQVLLELRAKIVNQMAAFRKFSSLFTHHHGGGKILRDNRMDAEFWKAEAQEPIPEKIRK